MTQNKHDLLSCPLQRHQSHLDQAAADAGFLEVGMNRHRPQTDGGGLAIDLHPEKLDMPRNDVVVAGDKRQHTVVALGQLADDAALFLAAERQIIQRDDLFQVVFPGRADPETPQASTVSGAIACPFRN